MCVAFVMKIILGVINFVFFLVGIAFAAVGAILAFFPGQVLDKVYDEVKNAVDNMASSDKFQLFDSADEITDLPFIYEMGIFFLILGCLICVVSLLGMFGCCCTMCCGCLLVLFAIAMGLFMVIEITGFSLFLVEDSPAHSKIRTVLKDQIPNPWDDTDTTNDFAKAINLINYEFKCCGIDGVSDFSTTPNSCGTNTNTGCYTKLQDTVQDYKVYIALGLTAVLIVQLLEIIFALYIYKDSSKISPI